MLGSLMPPLLLHRSWSLRHIHPSVLVEKSMNRECSVKTFNTIPAEPPVAIAAAESLGCRRRRARFRQRNGRIVWRGYVNCRKCNLVFANKITVNSFWPQIVGVRARQCYMTESIFNFSRRHVPGWAAAGPSNIAVLQWREAESVRAECAAINHFIPELIYEQFFKLRESKRLRTCGVNSLSVMFLSIFDELPCARVDAAEFPRRASFNYKTDTRKVYLSPPSHRQTTSHDSQMPRTSVFYAHTSRKRLFHPN
jgi:hypothetical protein